MVIVSHRWEMIISHGLKPSLVLRNVSPAVLYAVAVALNLVLVNIDWSNRTSHAVMLQMT